MSKVCNEFGLYFDWNAAHGWMYADICNELDEKMPGCSLQEFFDAYCLEHEKLFGEVFELAKENPSQNGMPGYGFEVYDEFLKKGKSPRAALKATKKIHSNYYE